MHRPPLAIYGAGRFGRAIAVAAHRNGLPIKSIGNRSATESPIKEVAVHLGVPAFLRSLDEPTLVLVCVADDAIADVAAEFAAGPSTDHWFVHTSGSRTADALKPLKNRGCFHVLQSFPVVDGADRVKGSYCAISAPDPLRSWLFDLATAIEAIPFDLPDAARVAYHTAAVVASNALVGLADTGRRILEQAGVEQSEKILLPLMQGTLDNLTRSGGDTASTLTGPVARGDVETIKGHLDSLSGDDQRLYVTLMEPLLALSRAPEDKLSEIRKLFDAVLAQES